MTARIRNILDAIYGKNVKYRWLKILVTLFVIGFIAAMIFNVSFDLGWFHWQAIDPTKLKK